MKDTDYLPEFLEFLRIPTVSSLPEHQPDIERGADWLAARLRRAGLQHVQLLETEGPRPAVYADWLGAEGKPTVLIYGARDASRGPAEAARILQRACCKAVLREAPDVPAMPAVPSRA